MTLTITLSSLTKKQWKDVGQVAAWVISSGIIGVLVAYLTKDPYVSVPIAAGANTLGMILKQVGTQEESQLIAQLPSDLQSPIRTSIDDVSDELDAQASKILADAAQTKPSVAVAPKAANATPTNSPVIGA